MISEFGPSILRMSLIASLPVLGVYMVWQVRTLVSVLVNKTQIRIGFDFQNQFQNWNWNQIILRIRLEIYCGPEVGTGTKFFEKNQIRVNN